MSFHVDPENSPCPRHQNQPYRWRLQAVLQVLPTLCRGYDPDLSEIVDTQRQKEKPPTLLPGRPSPVPKRQSSLHTWSSHPPCSSPAAQPWS